MTKILVANRGEIACRILRTLRDMGHASVAVASEADLDSPHLDDADEVVEIGPPDPRQSYLSINAILTAAAKTGATAIHPGYGFLSTNAEFAAACERAGRTFIGPSSTAMAALGDKRGARATAERCGVPVLPGARETDSPDAAQAAADRVGYPVLLKAAGGGGGRGLRRVDDAASLPEAFEAARREAEAAFGDRRMFVEKFLHPARHVEIQILGDGKSAVALGERECSLQRRYQKVIEESPSIAVSPELRSDLSKAAVKLAVAAGYANAGTVEFLLGPDGSWHFLEVNARLQVEHPLTELRFGIDLVRAQVEIALGGPLPSPAEPRGHAIEARLNAEDPGRGFLPMTGRVAALRWPQRPDLRIDAGIRQGQEILPFYDSLLAKLIAWGPDRDSARRRLAGGLRDLVLAGVPTNQKYLLDTLESGFFQEGETFTTTLESRSWTPPEPSRAMLLAAAGATGAPAARGSAGSPWQNGGAWRLGS
ncbi:MAG TPA: biotin carboxylase N-terminal domain-containing protein [Planctomycetota bacterium]|nr:biotin carboxylase N-terminal domain-containing protein [Planctomycetota bacterium]